MISTSEEILKKYLRNTEGKWARELKTVGTHPNPYGTPKFAAYFLMSNMAPPSGERKLIMVEKM